MLTHSVTLGPGRSIPALVLKKAIRQMLAMASKSTPSSEQEMAVLDAQMDRVSSQLRNFEVKIFEGDRITEIDAEIFLLEAILQWTGARRTSSIESIIEKLSLGAVEQTYLQGYVRSEDKLELPADIFKLQQYLSFILPSYSLMVLHCPQGLSLSRTRQNDLAINLHARRAARIRTALAQFLIASEALR